MLIRQNNLQTLVDLFTGSEKEFPPSVKLAKQHRKQYEAIARNLYENVLNYKLKQKCKVRESACVIQPILPWLLASPHDPHGIGPIGIKYPKRNISATFNEMVSDNSFYIG